MADVATPPVSPEPAHADAKPEAEPRGLRCPRCNCGDWRTIDTRPAPAGRVRRYKACRHCGKRVVTFEVMAGHLRPPDRPVQEGGRIILP
jgi:hypothetical protein